MLKPESKYSPPPFYKIEIFACLLMAVPWTVSFDLKVENLSGRRLLNTAGQSCLTRKFQGSVIPGNLIQIRLQPFQHYYAFAFFFPPIKLHVLQHRQTLSIIERYLPKVKINSDKLDGLPQEMQEILVILMIYLSKDKKEAENRFFSFQLPY